MIRKLLLSLTILLVSSFGFVKADSLKWDMPLAYSAKNYQSETAAAFAAAVTETSGGSLTIVTHPNGSLYKGSEIFRAVGTGHAPIGERLISALGNEDPIFELDTLPFLATSFADAKKLHEAVKPAMQELLVSRGVMMLYAVPWPPQGIYSKRPINSVADMKNVKFRAYNPATIRLAELMGAIPTEIEVAELSQAFATGQAESMISSSSTGYDTEIWEFVDIWYDVQAWLPKNMVIVNLDAWNSLDEATQNIVLNAAAQAEANGWAKAESLAQWYAEQLAANGMTVKPAGDQLMADFRKIGEILKKEWLERAGASGDALINAYKSM